MGFWRRVDVDPQYAQTLLAEDPGEASFILDADPVLQLLLPLLEAEGYSVAAVPLELRARGHAGVLAEAWRQNRMLIAYDAGYLDFSKYPVETSPGVVVIPEDLGDPGEHFAALDDVLSFIRPNATMWRGAYVRICAQGIVEIWNQNVETFEMDFVRLRLHEDGSVDAWEEGRKV